MSESAIMQRRGASASAWLAFLLGIGASVAGNMLDVAGRPGRPGAALFTAAFWPLALLGAVEVISRVRWRSGAGWWLARYAGAGAVAAVCAVVSYTHMSALLTSYGEDQLSARIGPVAVDGLMVVAGFALLSMGMSRPMPLMPIVIDTPQTSPPIAAPAPAPAPPRPAPAPARAAARTPAPRRKRAPVATPAQLESARQAYRDSRQSGKALTGAELGHRFGYGPRWGRARITEVNQADRAPTLTGELAGVPA